MQKKKNIKVLKDSIKKNQRESIKKVDKVVKEHLKNKKSIKGTLLKVYITMIVVMSVAMCIIGLGLARTGMKKVQSNLMTTKLESDIQIVQSLIKAEYGRLEVYQGDLLAQDKRSLRWDNTLVDEVKESTGDVVSIFVKQEKDFERIATNMENQDGARSIGSKLDETSSIYKTVLEDKRYVGNTTIEGIDYLACYEPIKNQEGETIGLLSVGLPKNEVDALIASELMTIALVFIGILIGAIILASICTYLSAKKLVRPIQIATDYTYTLGQLDLTQDVPDQIIKQKDEIGILAHSLDELKTSLRQVVKSSHNLAMTVKGDASNLQTTSQYVNKTTEEINIVVDQIAGGATHQAQSTQDGAGKVEELGQLLGDNQSHIKTLEQSAENMEALKDEGISLIENLAKSSEQTKKEVEASYTSIVEAKEKADVISQASEMIKAIANQTGLLALNAAIEAARTGEEGKGFAVIATEIRKLSDQTNKFTKEIEVNIEELGNASTLAVKAMESITETIEQQAENVAMTNHKFHGIASSIDETTQALGNVLQVESSMLKKRDEIIGIMQTLSSIAEENAASTQEVASSIKEQSESVGDIYRAAQRLTEFAEQMEQEVAQFKL